MKIFTPCSWAIWMMLLLAAPAWAQPTWQWARGGVGSTIGNTSACREMTVDAAGNTIVAGSFTGTVTLGNFTLTSSGDVDLFVARLSPTGTWLQVVKAGGTGEDFPTKVAVDANGTITVAGYFLSPTLAFGSTTLINSGPVSGSTITDDVFVAQLSSTGTWTMAARAGGNSADNATALALGNNGQIIVAGTFRNTCTFGTITLTSSGARDIFVAWLSSAGVWTQAVRAGGSGNDYAYGLVFDGNSNVLVAGTFSGITASFGSTTLTNSDLTGVASDVYVARLSASGGWTSVAQAGGASSIEQVSELAVTATGDALVYGQFARTASFGAFTLNSPGEDIFVARLASTNVWTQATTSGGNTGGRATGFAVAPDGTATVAGYFSGSSVSFGSIPLQNSNAGTADCFLAQLSPAGTWTYAVCVGGSSNDAIIGLAQTSNGDLVVSGGFASPTISFGPITITNPIPSATGIGSAFVARLTGLVPTGTRATAPTEVFTLSPNPTSTQVLLHWATASARARPVQVLDGLGRTVRQLELPAHTTATRLDVVGLAPGLYLVRCGAAGGRLVVE